MKRKINHFTNIQSALYLLTIFLMLGFNACKDDDEDGAGSQSQLKIESFYPNSGKGGTLVTIKGTGFSSDMNGNTVEFSGVKAEVFSAKEDELVILAPSNGQTGAIRLNNGRQTLEVGTYTYQDLSVQNIFPANGPTGTNIRISGEGFSSLQGPAKVLVNGKEAVVVNASDTLIVAKVPAQAGKGAIKVMVDGKESTGPNFIYQEIKGIKPLTGGKGTKITITGEGFDTELTKNQLYFNNIQAKVLEVSETKLVVEAPDKVETAKLALIINAQKTVGPQFTVVPAPTLSIVSPLSGPAGTQMIIQGKDFSKEADENKVFINGAEIPILVATGNELSLKLPTGISSGKVEVIVNDQKTIGPEFKNQSLGITKIFPDNGLAGTQVTIEGMGFSTNKADNMVLFNGIAAEVKTATENKLTVIAPNGLKTGVLKIETGGMVGEAPKNFNRAGITTLARGLTVALSSKIAVDSQKNIYYCDARNIYKISPDGNLSTLSTGFAYIAGFTLYNDDIYVLDSNKIKKVTLAGSVSLVSTDNISSLSPSPQGLSVDRFGNLYLSRSYGGVTKVEMPSGRINTTFRTSSLHDNCRTAITRNGSIYLSQDEYQGIIMLTLASGQGVNWLGKYEQYGYLDGPVTTAKINYGPTSLILDLDENLLIMDKGNFAIRKIDLETQIVSTLVKAKYGSDLNDSSLEFAQWGGVITDIAIDIDGDIYLLDYGNAAIRKIFLK